MWSNVDPAISRRWIHLAGLAWIGACLAVACQMFAGRSPLEPSPPTLAAVALLLLWMVALARGAWAWRSATRGRTAVVPPPQAVLAQTR
jgi:protein-S-isoprenylcysteine O-methyltransferase Ste14